MPRQKRLPLEGLQPDALEEALAALDRLADIHKRMDALSGGKS